MSTKIVINGFGRIGRDFPRPGAGVKRVLISAPGNDVDATVAVHRHP
jgi:glyceraldehyde-3-phosphate dehydrogenase/erythrose-4-phosphate dehydrogenase